MEFAEYPKWLYRGDKSVIVDSREEEDALVGDWYDAPGKGDDETGDAPEVATKRRGRK